MGGAIDIVSSTLGLAQQAQKPNVEESASTAHLRAERERQEKEQQEAEAEERRKKRQQVTEARDKQRKRVSAKNNGEGQTTLVNGGLGLTAEPTVYVPRLKQKSGE